MQDCDPLTSKTPLHIYHPLTNPIATMSFRDFVKAVHKTPSPVVNANSNSDYDSEISADYNDDIVKANVNLGTVPNLAQEAHWDFRPPKSFARKASAKAISQQKLLVLRPLFRVVGITSAPTPALVQPKGQLQSRRSRSRCCKAAMNATGSTPKLRASRGPRQSSRQTRHTLPTLSLSLTPNGESLRSATR
jgi:hypothetical protein